MLPYSPLHHLLLDGLRRRTGRHIRQSERRAGADRAGGGRGAARRSRRRLPASRPPHRAAGGRSGACASSRAPHAPLRLGRGTAPLELGLPSRSGCRRSRSAPIMKNTVALAWDDRAVVSPHIGDLASPRGREVFAQVAAGPAAALWRARRAHRARCASGLSQHTLGARIRAADRRRSGTTTRMPRRWPASTQATAPLLCFTWDGVGLGAGRHTVGWRGAARAAGRVAARGEFPSIPAARRRARRARAVAYGAGIVLGERSDLAGRRELARAAAAPRLRARTECASDDARSVACSTPPPRCSGLLDRRATKVRRRCGWKRCAKRMPHRRLRCR